MQRNQTQSPDDDESVQQPAPSFLTARELEVRDPAPHVLKDVGDDNDDEGEDDEVRTKAKAPARKKSTGKSR